MALSPCVCSFALPSVQRQVGWLVLLATYGFTASASAQESYTDQARVVRVDPIITRERVTEPVEQCTTIEHAPVVRYQPPVHRRPPPPHDVVRSVVGGLIGGAVGSKFGKGRGRKAMTVLGALAGSRIANNRAARDRYYDDSHRYVREHGGVERSCEQVMRVRDIETIEGYRVRYRYQGIEGTRVMAEPPGDTIPISVRIEPVSVND
ncbi:MAG: glycine zipper 2TM domain-containing protein [Pseudomonadota bacterium]